jgi:Golgi nucleoside diphosphatase
MQQENGVITNPCYPVGYYQLFTYYTTTYNITGSGDVDKCKEQVLALLSLGSSCDIQPCSMNGVYQPSLTENMLFYGFSGFAYTYQVSTLRSVLYLVLSFTN